MDEEHGEWDIADPVEPPALDLSWSTVRKAQLIRDWFESEFQQFSEFDFSSFGDEDEIANSLDLIDEVHSEASSTSTEIFWELNSGESAR